MTKKQAMESQPKKRVLIFDDDTSYMRLLKRHAETMNIEAITCQSIDEYCLSAIDGKFDVALIDFHLENFKGPMVAAAIEKKPIIMMSGDKSLSKNRKNWPQQIVDFIQKDAGPRQVLVQALSHVP
jgi:DNA-binding NtrC family response regulator